MQTHKTNLVSVKKYFGINASTKQKLSIKISNVIKTSHMPHYISTHQPRFTLSACYIGPEDARKCCACLLTSARS